MFDYDPEAVVQDADIEMARMSEMARRVAALRKRGICTHQSSLGFSGTVYYPEQETMRVGQQLCTDLCGRLFDSAEEMYADAERHL